MKSGEDQSYGYGSVTPQYTIGDSLSQLGMTLSKYGRENEAFNNCMASKGWSKVQANSSAVSYQGNQSNIPDYQSHIPNYKWQLIFRDDFDNNKNNWLVDDNNIFSAQLQYGKYIIEHKRNYDSYTIGIKLDNNIFSNLNFAIQSSIQKISGADNYGYGLVVGKDFLNCYGFYITSNGQYTLIERKNGITSHIIPWKTNSIIFTGNSHNVIVIMKNNNVTRFFINGTYVDEINNLNYSGNHVGFSIDNNQKIAVDYLTVDQ